MNKKPGWIGDPQTKDIRTTKSESETRLSKMQGSIPGLLGYGITRGSGERISVLVEKTTPEIESMFREGIRGHKVKIIEIGHVVAFNEDRTTKYRPLTGGISIGHYKISAGTLGSIVYDKDTNEPLILSNCHVLANSDTPADEYALQGDPIYQPGLYDNQSAETCAELHDWIPLEDGTTVDAAVAVPLTDISNTVIDIPKITGVASPEIGAHIRKSGRTTGHTEGEILSIESVIDVQYNFGMIRLTDQFITTAMSAGGDSGSVGVNDNNKAIGLLFAGSEKVTIFNDINNVTRLLNIKFVSDSVSPAPSEWISQNDAILIALTIAALAIAGSCIK